MDIIAGGMSVFILYWCILFDMVPRAPITTGMTTTLIFETFCNSVIKTWYLSIFFCYLMALVNFFLLFKGYILVSRNCKGNNLTLSLSFACWYKLCLVTCTPRLYLFEYWNPKGLYIRQFPGLIVVCVCVCVCVCVYHLSLHCKWCFLHSNQCT